MRLDVVLYTSGFGGDYRIVASSRRLLAHEEKIIESKALFKGIIPAGYPFKAALRVFNVGELKAVSYITSGRDELGRPGRLRAQIFLLSKKIYLRMRDPRALAEFFRSEDVVGELQPLDIDEKEIVERGIKSYRDAVARAYPALKRMEPKELAKLIGCILIRERVLITNSLGLDEKDFLSSNPSTLDFLVLVTGYLPSLISERLEYSTVTFGPDENVDISFYIGPLRQVRSSPMMFRNEWRKVEPIANAIAELMHQGRFGQLLRLKEAIDSVMALQSGLGKRGFRALVKSLDEVIERWRK